MVDGEGSLALPTPAGAALWNSTEAASVLGLSDTQVRNLARSGALACVMTQRGSRISYEFEPSVIHAFAVDRATAKAARRPARRRPPPSRRLDAGEPGDTTSLSLELELTRSRLMEMTRSLALSEANVAEVRRENDQLRRVLRAHIDAFLGHDPPTTP